MKAIYDKTIANIILNAENWNYVPLDRDVSPSHRMVAGSWSLVIVVQT